MITDKLKIYADGSQAKLIAELVNECALKLELSAADTLVCVDDCFEEAVLAKDAEHLVIDYKNADKLECLAKPFTYSLSDSRADVTALNIQKREHSVCFELLFGSFMSRIFVPYTSEHTPQTVLVTCCVLLLWSASAEKVVETINELLK